MIITLWLNLFVALLAGGGSPERNNQSHLDHLVSLQNLLEAKGISTHRLTIFWADGIDENADRRLPDPATDLRAWMVDNTPWSLWFEHTPIVADTRWDHKAVYPAKRTELRAWLKRLKGRLKPGDTLLIAVTDHGRPDPKGGWRTSIELWGEEYGVESLYEDLQILPQGVKVMLWMSQCFSGGFAQLATMDSRVCGAFSATASRPAYGCFSLPSAKGRDGHFMYMVRGLERTGRLDLASDWTSERDDTPDTPHLSSDAFLQELIFARAEALGVPLSHLVDASLPALKTLTDEQVLLAQVITNLSLRFGLGLVHSYSRATALLEEVQDLQYMLDAWMAKWSHLLQEAKLRMLAHAPVDGSAPELISDRRRGRLRLSRWLKRALRRGSEGRRGLLKELKQRVERGQRLMDQLHTLQAVLLRLSGLYMRLAVEGLLSDHDLKLWKKIRGCESTPILPGIARQKQGRHKVQKDAPPWDHAARSLSELRIEVEALRPGHLALHYRERPRSKKVEVTEVDYGSPAWSIDLKRGDFIEEVEGRRLEYSGQLKEQVALHPVGEVIKIKRRRELRARMLHVPIVGTPLSPAPPKRGEQIPSLHLDPIFEGEQLDYLFTGGHPSLLFFWATWCDECLRVAPQVQAWALKHNLQVIAITDEDPNLVRAVLSTTPLPFPSLYDRGREASRLFHVNLQLSRKPIFVYLDAERRLIERGTGFGERGPARIELLFEDR